MDRNDNFNELWMRGGMLTGQAIIDAVERNEIAISDFDPKQINPNSYNMRLHPQLKIYTDPILDARRKNNTKNIIIPEEGFVLEPGQLYLGRTVERTTTDFYIPEIDGRSSYGRLGIWVHVTAGFGDIGFDGTWTLEIAVLHPLRVYPYDEIAQVCFFTPHGPTNIKYDGRYQGQVETTASRVELDKKVYVK